MVNNWNNNTNWLVVTGTWLLFFHNIYGMYNPKPIDFHSIIFQDGFLSPPSSEKWKQTVVPCGDFH
jgi:hypothetical protein